MANDKDKGDRPTGEEKVAVTIRLPAELVEQVDALADEEIRNRSAQIEKMLKDDLASRAVAQAG